MADINPGDLLFLKAGTTKKINKDYIGWVIGYEYSELWWQVEWSDGGVSTESAANVREYKKEACKKMQKLIKK